MGYLIKIIAIILVLLLCGCCDESHKTQAPKKFIELTQVEQYEMIYMAHSIIVSKKMQEERRQADAEYLQNRDPNAMENYIKDIEEKLKIAKEKRLNGQQ